VNIVALNMIVCVKETYDIDHIKIDSATMEPVLHGIPVEIEDLSKNALETAVRLKEEHGGNVTAVALSSSNTVKKSITEALAMGADDALIITPGCKDMNPAATALALAHGIRTLDDSDLVLTGEGSADNYSGQVGPRVAMILGLPFASYACKIELVENKLVCTSDLDEYLETVEVVLPSVVSVTNEINEPRLPSLKDILRASKKPVKEVDIGSLGIDAGLLESALNCTSVVRNKAPKLERKRIKLEGDHDEMVSGLISSLSKDGLIGG
jgi:electron transfer flavoprotein beta subunit